MTCSPERDFQHMDLLESKCQRLSLAYTSAWHTICCLLALDCHLNDIISEMNIVGSSVVEADCDGGDSKGIRCCSMIDESVVLIAANLKTDLGNLLDHQDIIKEGKMEGRLGEIGRGRVGPTDPLFLGYEGSLQVLNLPPHIS